MSQRRARPRLPLLLLTLLAPFTVQGVHAADATVGLQPDGRLVYTGDTARASVGYATGGFWHGELAGVLSENADSAWLGEGWFSRQAGGVKLSYQRLSGATVHKAFVAHDQNQTQDRKLSFGYGLEQDSWFGNANLSRGLSERRLIDKRDLVNTILENGSAGGAPFVDTVVRTTTTRLYEKGYDWGVGLRAGRYDGANAIRYTLGLDHEWGTGNARQDTFSLVAEKMFVGTPHSLALQVDYSRKSGDAEIARKQTRLLLTYRYSLGSTPNNRAERQFRMVAGAPQVLPPEIITPDPVVIPAHTESRWVKTKVSMSGDAFFEFDSARLTPTARSELDRIATQVKTAGREGKARIVGHTCDIGSDRVNDKLSLQRAQAVGDYLVSVGAFAAGETLVEGKGKREQKYPATPETREKNRRVELEYYQLVDKQEITQIPAKTVQAPPIEKPRPPVVTYEREYVDQAPAWIQRALRTPALHKRTVDVYRSQEVSQSETRSRELVNRAPVAQNDAYAVLGGSTTALAVLGNDTDPDTGDSLILSAVSAGAKGQVRLEGQQLIYVAPLDFTGQDSFSYTVKDAKGLSATGTVVVTVTQVTPANTAPVARDDSFSVPSSEPTPLNVLANDTDADGDTLTILSVTQPNTPVGTVAVVGQQIVFVPTAKFLFSYFTYTVSDGKGGVSTARVELIDP